MARSRVALNPAESGRTGSGGIVRLTGKLTAGLAFVRAERLFPHPVTTKEIIMTTQRIIVPRP
ncbi:MAG: hypothetical protein WCF57_05865 [Pyrinomonadaceae bacterium]